MRNTAAVKRALRCVTEEEIARFDALPLVEWEPSESYREKIAAIRAKTDRAPRSLSGKRLAAIIIAAVITMLTITACVFKEEIIVLTNKIYEYMFEEEEIFFEKHDDHVSIKEEKVPLTKIEVYYEPSWLPERFTEIESKRSEKNSLISTECDTGGIYYVQSLLDSEKINIDSEGFEYQEKIIGDRLVYYGYKETHMTHLVFWKTEDYLFFLNCGGEISYEEVETIIKSIKIAN